MDIQRTRGLTSFFVVSVSFGLLLCLTACGGGGGGYNNPPPASAVSYQTPQVFMVGQVITALNPTVTGTLTSYSVSPALPAGLALNASSGVISGTPTAITPQAAYTVTAGYSGGSTTAAVTITVNDAKPAAISYRSATVALATNVTITPLIPNTAAGGGTVVSWSINPALPTGLSLSTTDGSISGTPTAGSAATAYTITATNSGGQSTFTLTLSVQSGVLFDAGHMNQIAVLRFDGTRVFSADVVGHWVLWNYATGAITASGDSGCVSNANLPPYYCTNPIQADFAGLVLAIQTPTGFEIRSAADGHVISTIATIHNIWWQLAPDGSYLVADGSTGLNVWSTAGSTAGALLLNKQGTYLNAFAAPGQLQIPVVAGGQNVIETITLATGTSTYSLPFNGNFAVWFSDGNRFLSVVPATQTVLTYSVGGVQQDVTTVSSLSTLLATGNWFGSFDGNETLNIYKVGASGSPAATYTVSGTPSRAPVGQFILVGLNSVTVIDLSGATPTRLDQPTPTSGGTAYASSSPTQWLFGTDDGVLFDGASSVSAPRYLGYGAVWSIAGTGSRFVISTASGRILDFDSATQTQVSTIQDLTHEVVLSPDGTVLAALGDSRSDLNTKVYSLPGGGLVSTWPNNTTGPFPLDVTVSGSDTVLGLSYTGPYGALPSSGAAAVPVTGGAPLWSTTGLCATVLLSSDASHIACPSSLPPPEERFFATTNATSLYVNGALTSALSGLALGWLDDTHLLVNVYAQQSFSAPVTYQGAIYDPTGKLLGSTPLPELHEIQVLTPDTVYSRELNSIFAVSTGQPTWTSADSSQGIGAVAGNNVVFVSGTRVLALSR